MLVYPREEEDTIAPEIIAVGIVTDISPRGIGVILDHPVERGMGVVLVLNADSPQEQLLEASTLWAGMLPTSGHVLKGEGSPKEYWRVGLKFNSMDEGQNEFIEELLKSQR